MNEGQVLDELALQREKLSIHNSFCNGFRCLKFYVCWGILKGDVQEVFFCRIT